MKPAPEALVLPFPYKWKYFPILKRKKCAHNFQPVKLFPSFVGNLDLRERVCMVYVNIVG